MGPKSNHEICIYFMYTFYSEPEDVITFSVHMNLSQEVKCQTCQ